MSRCSLSSSESRLFPAQPAGAPHIFTIPSGRAFADDVAAGLLAESADPLALARTLILLPNRRSVRVLTEAFIRQTDGRALLLPRMAPIADIDPDETLGSFDSADFAAGQFGEEIAEGLPSVAPMVRKIALARLLLAAGPRGPAEALALADQLAVALDTLNLEGRRAADLAEIDPGADLQEHWRKNQHLLEIILRHWPDILAERGLADPTARRVALLEKLARRWADDPPPFRLLAAGIANAPPPVARLLAVIARLPKGTVVLPGLDLAVERTEWQRIVGEEGGAPLETHPQFGLARLLGQMRMSPAEVAVWPYASDSRETSPARARLIGRAMAPPAMSGELAATASDAAADALSGLRMLEARTPAEEALAIAIAMRQVVEHPGRTAALVTPDRNLARRVAVQLRRFSIDIDDSAGQPLFAVPAGSLLFALAAAIAERFAPVSLLALLKHPLVRAGDARLPWLDQVRALDRLVLRGLRPSPGLAGAGQRIAHRQTKDGRKKARLSDADAEDLKALAGWWKAEVMPCLAPLERAEWTAASLLEALRAAAEQLAGPDLWAGDGGRALAGLFESLDPAEKDLAAIPVTPEDAPALLRNLTEGVMVRPVWRRHPQLAIWGPLEARLQRVDLMILGGLNEGVWPGTPPPDPFLAPAIRRVLDLPGLPRRIGLMAHDFVMAAGAPDVLLTRSAREGSTPSVPSRFWQRLQAVAGTLPDQPLDLIPGPSALLAAARAIDRPGETIRIPRPEPAPPLALRPRSLSITEVATLRADPFTIYARRILGLNPLDPLDAEPTGADRGTLVHHILERWLREPEVRSAGVEALVDAELAVFSDRPELAALWRRRVERMVHFVVESMANDTEFTPFLPEARGRIDVDGIMLTGRADRIDRGPNGYRIIDYKTGAIPPVGKVKELWDTQLALLAYMLESGGIEGVAPDAVVALEYCRLSGGRNIGATRAALGRRASADEFAAHRREAEAMVRELVADYLKGMRAFTPKLHPIYGRVSRDYDQFARLAEWLRQ